MILLGPRACAVLTRSAGVRRVLELVPDAINAALARPMGRWRLHCLQQGFGTRGCCIAIHSSAGRLSRKALRSRVLSHESPAPGRLGLLELVETIQRACPSHPLRTRARLLPDSLHNAGRGRRLLRPAAVRGGHG